MAEPNGKAERNGDKTRNGKTERNGDKTRNGMGIKRGTEWRNGMGIKRGTEWRNGMGDKTRNGDKINDNIRHAILFDITKHAQKLHHIYLTNQFL